MCFVQHDSEFFFLKSNFLTRYSNLCFLFSLFLRLRILLYINTRTKIYCFAKERPTYVIFQHNDYSGRHLPVSIFKQKHDDRNK